MFMTATRVALGLAVGLASLAAACTSDPEGVSWTAPICAAGRGRLRPPVRRRRDGPDELRRLRHSLFGGADLRGRRVPVRGRARRLQRGLRARRAAPCGAAGSTVPLVTSAPGAYWKTDGQLTEVTSGNADVTVDDTATAQTWEGFGGAFNEMGWNVLSMLSPADRDRAIHLLYGADGARFAFGRIPIGASDYAIDRYTLDETAGRHVAGRLLDRRATWRS